MAAHERRHHSCASKFTITEVVAGGAGPSSRCSVEAVCFVFHSSFTFADVAWVPADACLQGLDEWTFGEDVIRHLFCCLANFAGCVVEDVFAGQGLTTVDPTLREEPIQEFLT